MFGLTTQAEQGRYLNQSLRLADRLERKAIPRFAAVLQTQLTAAAATYAHTQSVTQAEAEVTKRQPEMKAAMEKTWWESGRIYNEWAMSAWAKYARQRAKKAMSPAPGDFRAAMIWWTETHGGEQIKQVQETTKNYINTQVTRAAAEGEGPAQIAGRISGSVEPIGRFKYSATRARAIARTEVHNSSEFALQATIDDIGEEMDHQWLAAEDLRTRPTHNRANGQRRDRNTAFTVGGSRMMYPGDSSMGAPAGEIINCRCTVMFWPKSEVTPADATRDHYTPMESAIRRLQRQRFLEEEGIVPAAPKPRIPVARPIIPRTPKPAATTPPRVVTDIPTTPAVLDHGTPAANVPKGHALYESHVLATHWANDNKGTLTPLQFAKKCGINLTQFAKQVPPEVLGHVVDAIAEFHARYPGFTDGISFAIKPGNQFRAKNVFASCSQLGGKIELNAAVFGNERAYQTAKATYQQSIAQGFHPSTVYSRNPKVSLHSRPAVDTAYHEMVHAMHSMVNPGIDPIRDFSRKGQFSQAVDKIRDKAPTINHIKSGVSGYGMQNQAETVAEALVRVDLGTVKSEMSMQVHNELLADPMFKRLMKF